MKTAEHAKSAEEFSREGKPKLFSFFVFSAISAAKFDSAEEAKYVKKYENHFGTEYELTITKDFKTGGVR